MKYISILLFFAIYSTTSLAQYPGAATRGAGASSNMGHFYGKIVDANKKGVDGASVQLKGSKFDPATKKAT